MHMFSFYFGVRLVELVLSHSDNLSKTLQATKMSASEGQRCANMTVKTLTGFRNNFGMFWEKVTADAQTLNVGEPDKPRPRTCPRRLDIGNASTAFHPETAEDHFRVIYVEAVDSITSCITDRFDQPGYQQYRKLQDLLLNAINNKDYNDLLLDVTRFYGDDFNSDFDVHITTLIAEFQTTSSVIVNTIDDIVTFLRNLSYAERQLLDNIVTVVKLILVMPATNATSERSFSALRRVKGYLRGTMRQDRLNHVMLLHIHKQTTDSLNLVEIANDFVNRHVERRLSVFGKFI